MNTIINMREAEFSDANMLWLWRNDAQTRAVSLNSDPIAWQDHQNWLRGTLTDPQKILRIAETVDKSTTIGVVRFDVRSDYAIVSIIVCPAQRNKGYAGQMLSQAIAHFHTLHSCNVRAQIRPHNTASIRSFTKVGFRLYKEEANQQTFIFEKPIKASAIIVLANTMDRTGKLNVLSQQRADKAAELALIQPKAHLITTGWAGNPNWGWRITIAEATAQYLYHAHGLNIQHINPHARDTVGDAVFTLRDHICHHDYSDITIVTCAFHAARTQKIFEFVYGNTYTVRVVSSDDGHHDPDKQNSEAQSLAAFQDTMQGIKAGDCTAILQRLRIKHPYYNGTIYPQLSERASDG